MIDIFCINNHLVLDKDNCPFCDWVRPVSMETGQMAWESVQLPGGLGGPGPRVFAKIAIKNRIAVFPLRENILVGVSILDGSIVWQKSLTEGERCSDIQASANGFICAISDVRGPGIAEEGYLAKLSPNDGSLTPFWKAGSQQISPLTIQDDTIYLRTTKPELIALQLLDEPEVLWRQPLRAGSALAPLVTKTLVILPDGELLGEFGEFKVIEKETGQAKTHPIRTNGVLLYPLAQDKELVFYREGRKQLIAFNPNEANPAWECTFSKTYCVPAASSGLLYLATRGSNATSTVSDYRLTCLNAQTGVTEWEKPLPERVSLTPLVHHNVVLVGTEKGNILAFDGLTGKELWQCAVDQQQGPIQTELYVNRGLVVAGTYTGRVAAIDIGTDTGETQDPQTLLEVGDYESAAALFALEGELKKAAEIYHEMLHEPEKALFLLEEAGFYKEAGELAQELNQNTLALKYYRSSGDPHAEILILLRMGDTLKAAQKLEEIGELSQAAALYEKSGEPRKALEIYKQISEVTNVARLSSLVTATDEDIAFLEQAGRLKDAGIVAATANRFRKAVDLFHRANEIELEFETLQRITESEPEEWSFERLAELATSLKKYQIAAESWEKLKRPHRAARSFSEVAAELEGKSPPDKERIAALYEKAMHYFQEAGLSEEKKRCYNKVIFYRELPYIEVHATLEDKFREDEINEAAIEINNTGHGLAYDVQVEIGGKNFEVVQATELPEISRLASQFKEQYDVYLRPKLRVFGKAVPLLIRWSWLDANHNKYENQMSRAVEVRRRDESEASRAREVNIEPESLASSHVMINPEVTSFPKDIRTSMAALRKPLRVLFMASNPANTPVLDIKNEIRAIRNEIRGNIHSKMIRIDYYDGVRAEDLQPLLLDENPDIVHFSGHGGQGKNSGKIYLEDRHGDSHPVSSSALSTLFRLLKKNIRLVVLNACYSVEQAEAIAEHIDCVVGMTDKIEDTAARAFSTGLYRGIASGMSIEDSFQLGCNNIAIMNQEEVEEPQILAKNKNPAEITFF